MKNTVYIQNKPNDGKCNLVPIGTIDDSNGDIDLQRSGLASVDNFNEKLFDYIKSDNRIDTNVYKIIKSEDIIGIVHHILRWRRCTGYLVIQYSARGIRNLCYLYDKVNHHGQSFGTSAEYVTYDQVKKTFIESIAELNNHKTDINQHIGKYFIILDVVVNFNIRYGLA